MAVRFRNGKEEEYKRKTLTYDTKVVMKMSKELHEKSKQYAKEHDMSFARLVRESLNKYMEE